MKIEIINLFFSFGQNPSEFFFETLGIFLRSCLIGVLWTAREAKSAKTNHTPMSL